MRASVCEMLLCMRGIAPDLILFLFLVSFIKNPEYLREGTRLVFRVGRLAFAHCIAELGSLADGGLRMAFLWNLTHHLSTATSFIGGSHKSRRSCP
jgi:hypothetical protein